MSRNFIPCLGLVLGAAMITGTPALATGTVTEVVLQQAQVSSDLADRIEEAWAASKDLADAEIDARVEGTSVILEGQVATAAERQTAERLAKKVKGVTTVDNQIALRLGGAPTQGTKGSVLAGDVKDTTKTAAKKTENALEKTGEAIGDAAVVTKDAVEATPNKIDETWLTSKIAGKINQDDALENVDVDVKVKKNVVTITGDVSTVALRDRVLRIARETEGVTRVVDNMVVRPGSQQ